MKNKIFALAARVCFAAVLCLLLLTPNIFAAAFDDSGKADRAPFLFAGYERTEHEIFDLVNQQRRRNNLPDLEWDGELARLARDYSKKMADGGFFDHLDAENQTVVERAEKARIKNWSKIGENLFYCENLEDFSRVAVSGWMKSPTHKENILDADWNRSGIGIYEAEENQIYVTQVFIER